MDSSLAFAQTVSQLSTLGMILWEKGWAERNAGNISVNISGFFPGIPKGKVFPGKGETSLIRPHPYLKDQTFLVTGTGTRMRELASDPGHSLLIVRINGSGNAYSEYLLTNDGTELQPTSELSSHLSIHEFLFRKGAVDKAIIHTHPTDLITITQIRQYCSENALNHVLWGMHPETMIFIPEGAGFIPFMLPGSDEIAEATLKKFNTHRAVVWEKHGCMAAGKDVFEAFDLIDTLNKSASVFLRCKSAGYEPEGLSEIKLTKLSKLAEKFRQ